MSVGDSMTLEQTIKIIIEGFGETQLPGGQNLLHRECCDDSDIRAFYGKLWNEVDSAVLERENAALCFFSPTAFQYYLPAYLIWTLRNFRTSDSFTVDSTIYSLDPTTKSKGTVCDFAESKFTLFTPAQKSAISAFLEFMASEPDHCDAQAAKSALKYWNATVP